MANIDLFSYFPGLEVGTDEIMRAELLAYQVLSAKYPDMDLREGTAVRDMVIRPTATLLALTSKALTFYFEQNTVTGVTNDTPPVFVDKLMSNWFITRKEGNNSVINARLFFSKSKNVTIYPDAYFSTDGLLKFFSDTSQVFSQSNLTYDASSNQFYIDVDLVAEKTGAQYDIASGSLLYFTNFDPYFMHGEINYLKSTSVDIESNTDFLARTKSAISTRNLINTPSIVTNILENFSYVTDMIVNGFGDPGMIRDKIRVLPNGVTLPIWIHNGGCVDIYCNTSVDSSILQFELDSNGKVDLTGAIYKEERSLISGGDLTDTLPAKTLPISVINWFLGDLLFEVPGNTYIVGDQVTLSGITTTTTPTNALLAGDTSLTLTNDQGLLIGDSFTLAGAGVAGGLFTGVISSMVGPVITFSPPIDTAVSSSAVITAVPLVALLGCNLTYTISAIGLTGVITIPFAVDPGVINVTATSTSTLLNEYSVIYPSLITPAVSGITSALGIATATSFNHGLDVGERVLISGAGSPLSEYSGVRTVLTTPTSDTFTYAVDLTAVSPAVGSSITMSYPDRSKEYGFSERQVMTLDFGVQNALRTVSFIVHYFKNLDGINTYLFDKSNRVLCADLLARGFNLSFLDITITSYTGFSPDATTCSTTITAYLDSLVPGQPFIMSDLLSQLYAKGITTIKTPLLVTYNKYWKDHLGNTSGTITDIHSPEDPLNLFVLNSVITNFEVV